MMKLISSLKEKIFGNSLNDLENSTVISCLSHLE